MISFLLSIAVVVRNRYQSGDEIDTPARAEPKGVQSHEPGLPD